MRDDIFENKKSWAPGIRNKMKGRPQNNSKSKFCQGQAVLGQKISMSPDTGGDPFK